MNSNKEQQEGDLPPPPKGWSRAFSKSQKRYYYHHGETKHTQWHYPTASEVANPKKAQERAQANMQKEQERIMAAAQQKRSATTTTRQEQESQQQPMTKRLKTNNNNNDSNIDDDDFLTAPSIAIIVPFRDLHVEQKRAQHLQQFVPHMHALLGKLQSQNKISYYHIYIVEQSNDGRKFNRGKLLNIGFDLARKHYKQHNHPPHDVFIFHDVDLLPQSDLAAAYAHFPQSRPYHIARVWNRYSNNPKYFGGIVSFTATDFKRLNGYPNTFWGWGGEDDELQLRCEKLGLQWNAPTSGTIVDLEDMDLHQKLQFLRNHKEWKCMVKWEALEEHESTWKTNGLVNLSYKVLKEEPNLCKATGRATKITVDVKLNGNHWANEKSSVDYMGGDWKK